ncbi:MAG: acetolactate synthase [Phycisphaerae bacterium]
MSDLLPPQTDFGAGFEKVTIRQFTIFLDNRVGRLAQLMRCLEEAGLRINALTVLESADTALVRLVCNNPDKGRWCLEENKFPLSETEVLAVELPANESAPMIAICSALVTAELNIYYAYPLLRAEGKRPALVLHVDDVHLASRLLMRKRFRIIGESDLASPSGVDDED